MVIALSARYIKMPSRSDGIPMTNANSQVNTTRRLNLMDALLYLVAASAMTFISVTFLLWLRF
jgi:hypothetical protein